ncbi:MAG: RDD family protein [Pseudomonadota bacterium]
MTYLHQTSGLPDPHYDGQFYAGVIPKRAIAWLLDVVAITALTFLAGILTLTLAWWLWPLAYLTIGLIYRIGTLAGGSATPAMRLMGIELRGHDGQRLDGMQAALHVIGYYATMAFVLPMLATLISVFVTDRRQSLTDLVLGTAAINRPG